MVFSSLFRSKWLFTNWNNENTSNFLFSFTFLLVKENVRFEKEKFAFRSHSKRFYEKDLVKDDGWSVGKELKSEIVFSERFSLSENEDRRTNFDWKRWIYSRDAMPCFDKTNVDDEYWRRDERDPDKCEFSCRLILGPNVGQSRIDGKKTFSTVKSCSVWFSSRSLMKNELNLNEFLHGGIFRVEILSRWFDG